MAPVFTDRRDAGRQLAGLVRQALAELPDARDTIVLGLPRGGVPVAAEVACALGAPVDLILVRKVGVPGHRELAMGAIGEDGVVVVNDDVMRASHVDAAAFAAVEREEREELEARARRFRSGRDPVALRDLTVVIVDDGLATGATARAACRVARRRGAARVVLAVPVAPPGWERECAGVADVCVAVATPERFVAVGAHYADFHDVGDAEVLASLAG